MKSHKTEARDIMRKTHTHKNEDSKLYDRKKEKIEERKALDEIVFMEETHPELGELCEEALNEYYNGRNPVG